jgi:hypothetical protein
MRKRSILTLVVFVLVSAPVIALVWTCVIPEYQAKAEVRVHPSVPRLVFRTDENGAIPFYDSFVKTQVSIIKSTTILQRVLDQAEVKKTQWYKNPTKSFKQRLWADPVPPLERLREALKVQPRPQTEFIDITLTDPSASDAKAIVKAVQDQYIQYIGKKSNEEEDKLYNQLVKECKSLDEKIKGREAIIADLQKQIKTNSPQELITSRRFRLDETEARLSEIRQNIALLEWEKKNDGLDDNNDVPVHAAKVLAKPVDPNSSHYKKRTISLDYQLARAKREEELLVEYYNKQQREFMELFSIAQVLEKENNELNHKRDLFGAVRQRLDQKNMERNVRDVIAPVEMLQAFVPSEPYRDRRILFTVIVLVLGLGLSSGIVFLPTRRRKK